jgi:Na+-driven multidrug efflux pump
MNSEIEQNRLIFEELPVSKALMNMALPMVVSQLIILVYNMADTFFLGRTNNPLMVAGASLILPIYNVCIAVANVAGTGGGTLIARLLGISRTDEARKVATFSFYSP